jgi:hypothetical protein
MCVASNTLQSDANNRTASNSTAVRHTAATGCVWVSRVLQTSRLDAPKAPQHSSQACCRVHACPGPPSAVLLHAVMLQTRDNALCMSHKPCMQETLLCAQARVLLRWLHSGDIPVCACSAGATAVQQTGPSQPPPLSSSSALSSFLLLNDHNNLTAGQQSQCTQTDSLGLLAQRNATHGATRTRGMPSCKRHAR